MLIDFTQREIDPSVIEDASVAALQIVDAWNQVCVERRLHFQPAGKPLFLQQAHDPQDGGPRRVVRSPRVDIWQKFGFLSENKESEFVSLKKLRKKNNIKCQTSILICLHNNFVWNIASDILNRRVWY